FINSGAVNEQEGWVTGFDPTLLEDAQTQAQSALEQYIAANLPDPTVGDVIGGRKSIIREYPVLPSAPANKVVAVGARYGELPTSLQHRMSFAFGTDLLGEPIDPVTYPWAELNNQKITLSFKPATLADEEALASLLPEGEITDISQLPNSIPAYLIRVIPELKVNGELIKQGGSLRLGEEIDFSFGITMRGHGYFPYRYPVIAGSYLSVAVVGGSVSPIKLGNLKTRMEQTK
ncbi:MAG: hypothetical protein GY731_17410, partial [Gammaproteobacteria bacterium]|nr:hypothetical protein [Gammaproteobacteria bacterium]